MRIAAGILALIFGLISSFILTMNFVPTDGSDVLYIAVFGSLGIVVIMTAVFIFARKFWLASIVLSAIFCGLIPAILVHSSKQDFSR